MRRPIVLFCSQTGERYLTTKNKANTPTGCGYSSTPPSSGGRCGSLKNKEGSNGNTSSPNFKNQETDAPWPHQVERSQRPA